MQLTINSTTRRFARPLRFGLVGVSGIAINSAILWLLARELHLPVTLASIVATEVAILWNFALNDRWTFRDTARARPMFVRLLSYNGVALGGMVLTAVLLTLLTTGVGLPLLLANLFAIGAATVWNYIANSRWTWNREPVVTSQTAEVSSPPLTHGGELPTSDYRLPTTPEEVAL